MNNKTLKVAMATLAIVAGGSTQAGRDANIVNACSFGGMTVTVSGGSCNTAITQGGGNQGSRARGDVVRMDLSKISSNRLKSLPNASGTIQVPNVGEVDLYEFGKNEIVFASFSLRNPDLNPANLSVRLKAIIMEAQRKYQWAESMVWVGQVMPGQSRANRDKAQVTEITQTYINLDNLAEVESIGYEAKGSAGNKLKITIPATMNKADGIIMVDFKPIAKARR